MLLFFGCCDANIILKKPNKIHSIGIAAFDGCKNIEYVKKETGN